MSKDLNLRSGIYKNFKLNFLLDEDSLRRIAGILETSSKDLGFPCQVVFYVWRNDDRYYETTSIDDVLSDPNVVNHNIEHLSVEIRNCSPDKPPEPWEKDYVVQIFFRKHDSNKVTIDIRSENRNWALLLADNLQPQIERTFKIKKVSDLILIPFYASMGFFLYNFKSLFGSINFIPKPIEIAIQVIIILGILVLTYLSLSIGKQRAKWLIRYLGPQSAFLWGDESEQFLNRDRLRKNIFWVIIVGFIVSVAANLVSNSPK